MKAQSIFFVLIALTLSLGRCHAADEIPFSDFQGNNYGAWQAEGTAFGVRPAQVTLPGQMKVQGFQGKGPASSFSGGDNARGKLTSPEFSIARKFITFLIGGSERLSLNGWDLSNLAGKTAYFEIVDAARGGWGHTNVDQILFSDTELTLPPKLLANVSRDMTATKHWMWFPIKSGAEKRGVTVSIDGKAVEHLEIELADGQPEWWAPLDISGRHGKKLVVSVNHLLENSQALNQITQSNRSLGMEHLYQERLRPQFHFSAQRGWLNDPNGLAFYDGEYHLFFQHSPYSWNDGPKYWGQAVSRDLVHWEEIGEALAPDQFGAMWSGSGVVDHNNTSGFGKNGKAPFVLIYTAAGDPFVQCIAASTNGRAFSKFAANPVMKNITPGNRDPRVFWYEPTKHWVMTLWVEKNGHNTIQFLTSPNLRDWMLASITEGGSGGDNFLYECPDMFELPLDGHSKNQKWVLTAANGEYAIGTFDGKAFTAETTKLTGPHGAGFYAPQTFSDEPKGRRIQIGWFQTTTPGMPFNQSMSLPMELRLVTTPDGPRLTWTPVKELETLRAKSHKLGTLTLREGDANPLATIQSELIEIRAEFSPNDSHEVAFTVRGVPVIYDAKTHEVVVNGHRASAPLHEGKQRIAIFADRTGLEVFASDGLTFVPMPINLNPDNKSLSVSVKGGTAKFSHLEVYELRSAWKSR